METIMMKKMSILFILTLFLGALVGCGNDEGISSTNSNGDSSLADDS